MKDLVAVVNVAHQVKKLLKLYSLRKYNILLKWRLKLRKKILSHYATEQIVLPIFRIDSNAYSRTTDRIVSGNRDKGIERYGGDIT